MRRWLNCVWFRSDLVVGGGTGSTAQILAYLKKRGQERLLHIIRVLTENDYLPKLVSHFFGNYTLQNLLDAGYMLRHALQELQAVLPHATQRLYRARGRETERERE